MTHSPYLLILRSAALLVPHWRRADWLMEWTSELWYVLKQRRSSWDRDALSFCMGSFQDALWIRRNDRDQAPQPRPWLQSPVRCLVFLSTVGLLAGTVFFWSPVPPARQLSDQAWQGLIRAHLLILAIALLVLPATTSIELGEYPNAPQSPARANRSRRWIFLSLKLILIVPGVFFGTHVLGSAISATSLQPHAMMVGWILGFRWAFVDQRRRCPVCLRLLANPATIGEAGHTLLEWYGTELHCVKGHGLLHVPEIPTNYNSQRWTDLDASWSGLFL